MSSNNGQLIIPNNIKEGNQNDEKPFSPPPTPTKKRSLQKKVIKCPLVEECEKEYQVKSESSD